ncbi:hypothetical protein HPG69_007704 [Diceros bicornis minor]|uniref:Proprotein convertase subtilisin/kexin type 5 n=1 Tax=Diceros bicornis minor TaxID=77932 RepID=A0A7J7EAU0_DICBM|nr:hypothetical protein HPG69_007704 [Diceros bicornis minor]
MDAEAMVMEAEKWTTVPQQHVCVESTDRQIKTIRPNSAVRSIYKASGCSDNPNHHVNYLEHVVVRITITHPRRGDLAIYLTSPSGTRSQLLANRLFDHSMEGFKNWEFMTIHCWGERAAGDWILEVYDTPSQLRNFKTPGKLKEWSLVLYGTSVQPYSPTNEFPKVERVRYSRVEDPTDDYGTEDYAGPCDPECSEVGCDGPGPDHCNDCLHYYYKLKNNTRICVSSCPPGHYHADKKRCRKCAPNCESCFGSHGDQCLSCKYGYFLNEETSSCVTHCPDGSYQDTKKNLCRKCSENCKTCTESYNCTECRDGLSLQGSRCSVACEDGRYFNGQDCLPCHRFCATCAGAGADGCINCTEGYFMEDGRCVQSCSISYYFDHSSENGYKSCKRCDASCLTCSGPGFRNCTSCPSGYLLDLGTCQMGAICKDATEESWAEGGFCTLVKKNNLCQRKVLQQLCCKTSKKKSKPPLSFLLFFSLSLKFVQGDGELFCQNLNGKKKNKPTTSLPFITGCLVLNSQNHRDSPFFSFCIYLLVSPLRRLKIPFKNITRADIDQSETESSCISHFSCLSSQMGLLCIVKLYYLSSCPSCPGNVFQWCLLEIFSSCHFKKIKLEIEYERHDRTLLALLTQRKQVNPGYSMWSLKLKGTVSKWTHQLNMKERVEMNEASKERWKKKDEQRWELKRREKAWTPALSPVGVWRSGDQGTGHCLVVSVKGCVKRRGLAGFADILCNIDSGCIPGCREDDFV